MREENNFGHCCIGGKELQVTFTANDLEVLKCKIIWFEIGYCVFHKNAYIEPFISLSHLLG